MPTTTMPGALAAALCAFLACGCGSESPAPGPVVTISPSSLSVTAGSGVATSFQVTDPGPNRPSNWPAPQLVVESAPGTACPGTTWTLRGPGSFQVGRICDAIYLPPPAGVAGGSAVLTVSMAGAASGSVTITIVQP